MNTGRYFQLNLKASCINNDVTVYDYLAIADNGNDSSSPPYPISVVITTDSIRFRIHYYSAESDLGYNHVNEVILDLPFGESLNGSLARNIKRAYNTLFPSSINKYINKLLDDNFSINNSFVDIGRSYSTIWLWGLFNNDHFSLKEDNRWIGVLRKLLLDFMFDLHHSEVFQTSKFYSQMMSGLLSDFFYSALLHKCEFYYYRGLVIDELKRLEHNKISATGQVADLLRESYGSNLLEAEETWVADIMNPLSETHFQHTDDDFAKKQEQRESFRRRLEDTHLLDPIVLKLDIRDSWFANPEEEMRRVCFTMKDREGKPHLCNSEVLAEHFGLRERDAIHDLRCRVSRWFLKRNAFVDTLHMHFPKGIDWWFPILVAASPFLLICVKSIWPFIALWGTSFLFAIGWLFYSIKASQRGVLMKDRNRILQKRLAWWMSWSICGIFSLLLYRYMPYGSFPVLFLIISLVLLVSGRFWANVRIVPNIHLTLPRLVASIAAAWLSLAIGNELFISFFDAIPSYFSCLILAIVVFVFVIYEINKVIPGASSFVKFFRSFGIIAVSYCISLIVGLFVINFVGERFLERSYSLTAWYDENNSASISTSDTLHFSALAESVTLLPAKINITEKDVTLKDSVTISSSVFGDILTNEKIDITNKEILNKIKHSDSNNPMISTWRFGNSEFFILRDFLIQFAFLAMFIGVFIQMIFEEKSITEM